MVICASFLVGAARKERDCCKKNDQEAIVKLRGCATGLSSIHRRPVPGMLIPSTYTAVIVAFIHKIHSVVLRKPITRLPTV